MRWSLLPALTAFVAVGCEAGPRVEASAERVQRQTSAIVGGALSSGADDFVVFVNGGGPDKTCGGTLIAPNLVMTAKHCVYEQSSDASICGANGEPQPGAAGGFLKGSVPLDKITFYLGADGRKRFTEGATPSAVAKEIIDDQTLALCSHDIAFVVLDRPLAGAPLARLRLGTRPAVGDLVAVAGWGAIEERQRPTVRFRRADIPILRVGPATVPQNPTGSLGPKSFETGPGACSGDSGDPAFDSASLAALGVVIRGLNFDNADPISPCRPENVTIVHLIAADYPTLLRQAFTRANAAPFLEGRPEPGWLKFGETCASALECEGDVCDGAKTCNLDCTKSGATCPSGLACGGSGRCEAAPDGGTGADGGVTPEGGAPPGAAPIDDPEVEVGSCSTTHGTRSRPLAPWAFALLAACFGIALRRKLEHRNHD